MSRSLTKNKTFTRKRARSSFVYVCIYFFFFDCVPCFIYQFARTSGCSNGLIMNYFVTRIRHCVRPRTLSLSPSSYSFLVLFLRLFRSLFSIVSGGLTVNSELYVYDLHVHVRARVPKQYVQPRSFRARPHENTRRPLYAMRVWATSRLGVITGQPQMIVSRSPSALRLSVFSAHRPTERA